MRCRTTYDDLFQEAVEWLEDLPVAGLRRAVVLVPAERHAHALRRRVCQELGRAPLLSGVRLLRPVDLAREVLARSGLVSQPGWDDVRRLRILRLFESAQLRGKLRYFSLDQLRSGRGYADALAHTIGDLEAGGATPELALAWAEQLSHQDAAAATRLHDVATVWQACEEANRILHSTAESLQRAITTLMASPDATREMGPCLAMITTSPTTVLLRFLQALPNCALILQEARPLRTGTQRWRAQLDLDVAVPPLVDPTVDEIALVHRYLFELPETLTDAARPRSRGADASVCIEEHASVEEEVEATAVWIANQVEHGTAAEQIAVIVPDVEPYAPLLVDRIARLTADGLPRLCTHVAGGLSLAASPAGLRLLALLRALQRGLEVAATIRILPWLRHPNEGEAPLPQRLSPSKAARLIYEAGIVGGTVPDPNGVGEWVPRLTRHRDRLRLRVDSPAGDPTSHQQSRVRQAAQRVIKDIEHVLPAVTALQTLALRVHQDTPLSELWPEIREFGQRWLRLPADPPNLLAILDEAFTSAIGDAVTANLAGAAVVAWIMDGLKRQHRSTSRFGMPAVFIGTPASTAGLRFQAVRVLGLAEGLVPHTAHDDPILPDAARAAVEAVACQTTKDVVIARLADRVLDEIHDVFRVILGATGCLSLSVPRQSVDRSEREVSGIVLEVATALGRHDGGTASGDVPTASRLRSEYFNLGLAAHRRSLAHRPLSPRALLSVAARQEATVRVVPARWTLPGARSLSRAVELQAAQRSAALSPDDGMVSVAWKQFPVPGLGRQRPLSATALKMLIECPHRFMLDRLLFRREPPRRPPTDSIEPIVYGNLFHLAASRFLQAHGAAVCKHDHDDHHWIALGRAMASECLDESIDTLSVRGSDTAARERARLMNQMEYFVRYEWNAGSRNFYASEMEFGEPTPLELKLDRGSLYLRGAIDCVDQVSANALQVRDLKTGRVHDFIEEPVNPSRDMQLGIYVLVLEAMKLGNGAEVSLAAYVHPSATQEPDRQFVGIDSDALRRATRAWLSLAHDLLREGSFPRTPDVRDCVYCPFVAACADGAQAHSELKLRQAPPDSALARFLSLKKQRADRV